MTGPQPLPPPPPSPAASSSPLAHSLLLAEYSAVREEIKSALVSQQSTLNWTLGAFAVIFAGGANLATADDVPLALVLACFGVALPGIITVSSWIWMGELARMERAGRYMRGLEHEVATDLQGTWPLRWDTYITLAALDGQGRGRGKQRLVYFGGLVLYFGMLLLSEGIFVTVVATEDLGWRWTEVPLEGFAGVTVAVFLGVAVFVVRSLQSAGREAADLRIVDPVSLHYPLSQP